ncbi:MAG: hypothetical protein KTR31_40510 [Myxococcales bacterium]|nr:hypothetical protein [Myxococcales bacterium]
MVVVTAIVCFLLPSIGRNDSHFWRMVLAAVGVGMVGVAWLVQRAGRPERAVMGLRLVLAVLCTVGWFNYFQFSGKVIGGINDYTDTAYYYTNSKYLEELSYDGLYATAMLCDHERGAPRTAQLVQYRDLRDYELKPVAVGMEHGRKLKAEAFTPERWDAYCHDVTYFLDRLSKKALTTNFFVDHGYNPPPTWTVVGGNLATLFPVENLKAACTVDVLFVVAMFGCIVWAFGIEVMLFGMLFYVVTFSGRWPILGQAILRFDWVAALACGVAFLRKGYHGAAGASMAFAAVNRVFPSIFFLGWGLNFVFDTVREGRILERHRRFVAGAAVVTILLLGTSLAQYGPSTFVRSAENLRMHNETYSSHRVGLGDVLVFRGETTKAQIRAGGGIYAKELKVRAMQWRLRAVGLVAIAFVALYAWRVRREDWELVPLAVLPFFCITNPQINYYNLRILLFCWHGAHFRHPFHRVAMALLFGVEVATQATKVLEVERYTTTTTTSIGMALYLTVLVVWMARQLVRSNGTLESGHGSVG